jgi:hypothetical protein
MDLTTFLIPESVPPSELRGGGDPAPLLPHAELLAGRDCVIVFLRHVGCPFAEIALLEICRAADEYPEFEFVAVTQANWGHSRDWARNVGGMGRIHLFPDPQRHLYAAWGLGLTDWRHFAGASPLRAVAALYRETGIRNRHPVGTRWQRGGGFAVDRDGWIRFAHADTHAGDPIDIDRAARSLVPFSDEPNR